MKDRLLDKPQQSSKPLGTQKLWVHNVLARLADHFVIGKRWLAGRPTSP